MQELTIVGPDLDMDGDRAAVLRAVGLHTRAVVTASCVSGIRVRVRIHTDAPLDGLDDVLRSHCCVNAEDYDR